MTTNIDIQLGLIDNLIKIIIEKSYENSDATELYALQTELSRYDTKRYSTGVAGDDTISTSISPRVKVTFSLETSRLFFRHCPRAPPLTNYYSSYSSCYSYY